VAWTKTLPNPLGPGELPDALIDWVYFAVDRRSRTLRLDVEVRQAQEYPPIAQLRREYLISDSTVPSYTDLTGDGMAAAASELEAVIGAFVKSRPEFAGAIDA
jgi:hypothetical protein